MLAIGLSLLLFGFWAVVGQAALTALRRDELPLQGLLLAPVVGLTVTMLPVFWLNRLGLPVASFGIAVAVILLLGSAVALGKWRPKLPWRDYLPFVGVLLAAIGLTGYPLLEFGFDWVSYANDDMANYSLSALRFLEHGYFEVPNVNQVVNGWDYSLVYWLLYLPDGFRSGSDLMLAWVSSLTGLNPHQVFMPTILAFHLTLISAAGALVYQARSLYLAAVLTCGLLSLSALNSLGTLYQLVAQVSGLAILMGGMTVLLRPLQHPGRRELVRDGLLAGVLTAGLLVFYSEVLPFLVLVFLLYSTVQLLRRRSRLSPILLTVGIVLLTNLVLLNTFLVRSALYILLQTQGGTKQVELQTSLFPYYLLPSGLANLWSLQGIADFSHPALLSIAIGLGACLSVTAVIAAVELAQFGQAAATMTCVMLLLGIVLFTRNNDFGLYKLAMFIQPFLVATMVVWWIGRVRQPLLRLLPLVLVGLISLTVQQINYVSVSRGLGGAGFSEIPNASQSRINAEFRSLVESTPAQSLILETSNVVLAKFQSLYTEGKEALFPSRDFYDNIYGSFLTAFLQAPDRPDLQPGKTIFDQKKAAYRESLFDLHDPAHQDAMNAFLMLKPVGALLADSAATPPLFIATTSQQDIFNNRRFQVADGRNYAAQPEDQVRDVLIFTQSKLGQHYYGGQTQFVSLYRLEGDWFFPGHKMAGLGRYFLFEVLHPSEAVRLELSMTASLKGDRRNQLPPAVVIGEQRQNLGLVGRGSAHVFSPPLSPQAISDRQYLGIDMGTKGSAFPDRRSGLMTLYGKDIPLDRRQLIGFGRDISLVSEAEYAALNAPGSISQFPSDLGNPALEYSGIYEDGWLSEAAFVALKPSTPTAKLVIKGAVPELRDKTFTTTLTVLVDGKEVSQQVLKLGAFAVKLDVPVGPERKRIDLRFSEFQQLPGLDGRPVAAQVNFIGFSDEP